MVTIRTTPTVARFNKQERLGEATSDCTRWIATVKSYFYSAGQVGVQLPLIGEFYLTDVVTGIAAVTGGGSKSIGATIKSCRKIIETISSLKSIAADCLGDICSFKIITAII